jgi:hypothetical protein
MKNHQIMALLSERNGYVRRNLPKRVAEVDQVLGKLGHIVETATAEPQTEQANKPAVKKRFVKKD